MILIPMKYSPLSTVDLVDNLGDNLGRNGVVAQSLGNQTRPESEWTKDVKSVR